MISPSCPAYYRMTETDDLNHWGARRLTEAAPVWSTHPDSLLLNVLWVEMLRYIVRLPFKGAQYTAGIAEPQQDYLASISDARKGISLLRDIIKALSKGEGGDSAAEEGATQLEVNGDDQTRPLWGLCDAPGIQAIPDDLRDKIIDLLKNWPGWYTYYYCPERHDFDNILIRNAENHEKLYANQIASGELARIVLNIDDKPPVPAFELPCVAWEDITEQARDYIRKHRKAGEVWLQMTDHEGEVGIFTEDKIEKAEEYQGKGKKLRRITLPPAPPPTPLPTRWGMAASSCVQALPIKHVQEILYKSSQREYQACAWYYQPHTDEVYPVWKENLDEHDQRHTNELAAGTLCRIEIRELS